MKTALKTFVLLSSIVFASLAYGSTPVTVTGNLQTTLGTNLQGDAKVCFRLKNFSGFIPRVAGSGVIASTYQCAFPDVNGNIATTLWGNDIIAPGPDITYYSFEFWSAGKAQMFANFLLDGASFNFNTASVVNPPPVPSGPSIGGAVLLSPAGPQNILNGFVLNNTGGFNGPVGNSTAYSGVFTTVSVGGNETFSSDNTYSIGLPGANRPSIGYFGTKVISPAFTISGVTGSTQCLHVDLNGVISGTGTDCAGGGGGGGTVTHTLGALTLNDFVIGNGSADVKDSGFSFASPGALGTTTPNSGAFTTGSFSGTLTMSNGGAFSGTITGAPTASGNWTFSGNNGFTSGVQTFGLGTYAATANYSAGTAATQIFALQGSLGTPSTTQNPVAIFERITNVNLTGLNPVVAILARKESNGANATISALVIEAEDDVGGSGPGDYIEAIRAGATCNHPSGKCSAYAGIFTAGEGTVQDYDFLISVEANVNQSSGTDASTTYNNSKVSAPFLAGCGGNNICTAGYTINASQGHPFRWGFVAPPGTNDATEADFGSYSSTKYGFDALGVYSNAAIRIPNNTQVVGRNQAGSADVNLWFLDTSNRLNIGTGLASGLIVSGGIGNGGSGMKHIRVTSCTTGTTITNTCTKNVVWANAFADTNYTTVCSLEATSFIGHVEGTAMASGTKTASAIDVIVMTDTNNAITGTLNCIAMHD